MILLISKLLGKFEFAIILSSNEIDILQSTVDSV